MEYFKEIISFIIGAIAGGITVKWQIDRSVRKTTIQTGNTVGGDMAGRDIKKN